MKMLPLSMKVFDVCSDYFELKMLLLSIKHWPFTITIKVSTEHECITFGFYKELGVIGKTILGRIISLPLGKGMEKP